MFFHINLGSQGFQRLLKQVPIYRSVLQNIKLQLSFHPYGAEYMIAVSQFRVCILRRTRPLRSSKTVEPLEHFLVASPDVLPLCHDFCRSGPQKWRSTPHDVTIFSLSLFFFGHAKNLGMCEAMTDSSSESSKKKEKKELWIGTDFTQCCDVIGLQMCPLKDADPELRHSKWLNCPLWVNLSFNLLLLKDLLCSIRIY